VLLSIINNITKVYTGKVILTTRKACIGMDLLFAALRAFVISTEEMSSMDELYQPLGRSSRIASNISLLGAVFTLMDCDNIDSLRQGLIDRSSDIVLFSPQYRENLKILQRCSKINSQNPKHRFTEAVQLFNTNSNADVRAILRFIPDFNKIIATIELKEFLPTQIIPQFIKAPAPKQD